MRSTVAATLAALAMVVLTAALASAQALEADPAACLPVDTSPRTAILILPTL